MVEAIRRGVDASLEPLPVGSGPNRDAKGLYIQDVNYEPKGQSVWGPGPLYQLFQSKYLSNEE